MIYSYLDVESHNKFSTQWNRLRLENRVESIIDEATSEKFWNKNFDLLFSCLVLQESGGVAGLFVVDRKKIFAIVINSGRICLMCPLEKFLKIK